MKLRCKRINGKRMCPLVDVARVAGVHRNALYSQRQKLGVVRLFDLNLIPERAARSYVARHAPVAARTKGVRRGK